MTFPGCHHQPLVQEKAGIENGWRDVYYAIYVFENSVRGIENNKVMLFVVLKQFFKINISVFPSKKAIHQS